MPDEIVCRSLYIEEDTKRPGIYRYRGPEPEEKSERVKIAKKNAIASRVREKARENSKSISD